MSTKRLWVTLANYFDTNVVLINHLEIGSYEYAWSYSSITLEHVMIKIVMHTFKAIKS